MVEVKEGPLTAKKKELMVKRLQDQHVTEWRRGSNVGVWAEHPSLVVAGSMNLRHHGFDISELNLFHLTLIFHQRGSHWCWNVFVKIHSDPFGPQHINCLRCLAPSWHISAVAPAGSEGCCPVPGALLHRGALDFSPFRVTTSSCNGGWSERFRCLWSARITFGISFYFLPFVSAQVNSGKMDIKKKSQVTVFSFVPSIPASQGWYHLMSRKSFASSSRSTASPRRQVKLPTVGRAGKVCGKVFSGIDWCLNTEHLNFFWVRQVWPAKVGS